MQENIIMMPLEEIMGERFGRYSKYIIQDRALPDARDGLKPVQRRILYAMHQDSNTSAKAFRKSAKTVGNVIGNYHPHGDSSVYEAMVRMSQDWKLRNPLIEMHGNNGSIDGDPAAAMRYTEARLSKLSDELLRDIEKDTVLMAPNFDDTINEPTVLPARYPNLLVNGATGISSGYATDIPPHHLGEIIDATIKRMESPNCRLETLMNIVLGPDFPTGGTVQGKDGIRQAFETGKGKVIVRSKYTIEKLKKGKSAIIITEIPYEVNKANLVRKIDEIRIDKKIDGILEVRDESDRTGLRIAIEVKEEVSELIVNYLLKNTDLQRSYNYNMVAIINKRPMQANLLTLLDAYIEHQLEVVERRSVFDLKKAKARAHIVEGLMRALSILDELIELIRNSKNKKDAKENLIRAFDFSEAQAEAIVMLQLYRLTNTDITALEEEAAELRRLMTELEGILRDEAVKKAVVVKELKEVKKEYNTPRRSVIEDEIEEVVIDEMAMIPSEDVIVTLSKHGYIKRTSLRSHSASEATLPKIKEEDYLLSMLQMNTHDTVLIFTKNGEYLFIPVHELPEIKWGDLGMHLSQHIPIDPSDEVMYMQPVKDFSEVLEIVHVTKQGMIKKSLLADFEVTRYNKTFVAVKLKKGDEVVSVFSTDGTKNILLATNHGMGLSFPLDQVNAVGIRAAGVKGINLKKGDYVSAATSYTPTSDVVLLSTNKGAMKRMHALEFIGNRANRGVMAIKEVKSNPHEIISLVTASPNDTIQYFIEGEEKSILAKDVGYFDRTSVGSTVVKANILAAVLKAELYIVPEVKAKPKKETVAKKDTTQKIDDEPKKEVEHVNKDLTIDDFLDDL